MSSDLALVLALLGAAILMFAVNRPRADAVALIMVVLLPFTGVIRMEEAIAGFANPNVVLIGAMFVIGESLARTGVAQKIGDWLARNGGSSPARLLTLLMLCVGLLGSVMSSTGVVAIFIPVVLRIASQTGLPAAQLLMPMAYAALISGTLTLVATSSNLVINYELVRSGVEGFGFFAFTPFGLPILAAGTLYMLVARRWLDPGEPQSAGPRRPRLLKWVERYRLADRELRVRVRADSPLLARTLAELGLSVQTGVRVLLVQRGRGRSRQFLARREDLRLAPGDILLLDADTPHADPQALAQQFGVDILPRSGLYFLDRTKQVGMAEAMIPYTSGLVGKTVAEMEGAAELDLTVVGLRRRRDALGPHGLREKRLKVGDTVLLAGPWKAIRRLQTAGQGLVLLNLPREFDEVPPAAKRAPQAVLVLLLVVVLMSTGLVPNVQAALIGCLLMGLFGCIDLDRAYRAIQWKSLIMIVGMLPFALALDRTGGIDLAADALVRLVGGAGPQAALALLFAVATGLGLFISGTANAVLLIPLALAVAEAFGASPYPFAMTVALAAACAFMTPISPVNALVTTAGNYRFIDFVRIGLPLTVLVMAIAVFLVPWLLPF
jgi:di/tricarboxylate transporter